jgi:hypothetical protein
MFLSIGFRSGYLPPEKNIDIALDRTYQISFQDRSITSTWISYGICNYADICFTLSDNGILQL